MFSTFTMASVISNHNNVADYIEKLVPVSVVAPKRESLSEQC